MKAELITREQIESGEEERPILFNKFRVRLLKASDVPIVANISSLHSSEILLVDLSTPDVVPVPVNHATREEMMDCAEDGYITEDSKNISGVEISGSPVKVSFLTLEKAEAAAGGDATMDFEFDIADCDGSSIDINPLRYAVAMTARNMLFNGAQTFEPSLESLPVCLITKRDDSSKTALIGYHKSPKSISTYAAKCLGYGSDSVAALDKHQQGFLAGLPTKSVAACTYEIYRRESPREEDDPDRLSASLSLNAQWTLRNNEVLTAPVATAPVAIRFCPGWLDRRLVLMERSRDLKLLIALSEALKSGEMIWPDTGDAEESNRIVSEVGNLIREEGISKKNHNTVGRFVDFTEKLWDILKKCTNSATLVKGLKRVFSSLEAGELVVMLHKENWTTMARLLRSANTENLILPRLEALMPYQILLEIGIERIKNDMCSDFLQSRMLNSVTDLTPFFKTTGQPETRVDSLIPIHLSLQFMLECEKILCVTDHRRIEITRAVVSRYCSSQAKMDMRVSPFEVKITLVDVRTDVLKSITPSVWNAETTHYRGKIPVAQSIVIFSRRVHGDFIADDSLELGEESTSTAAELDSNESMMSRRRVVTKSLLIDDYNCTLVHVGVHIVPFFVNKKTAA